MLKKSESKQMKMSFVTLESLMPQEHFLRDLDRLVEFDFIYDKVVEKYPSLCAEPFYLRLYEIQNSKSDDKVRLVKDASDKLLANIKEFLADEEFVHELHDKWGFGIDKVI